MEDNFYMYIVCRVELRYNYMYDLIYGKKNTIYTYDNHVHVTTMISLNHLV